MKLTIDLEPHEIHFLRVHAALWDETDPAWAAAVLIRSHIADNTTIISAEQFDRLIDDAK